MVQGQGLVIQGLVLEDKDFMIQGRQGLVIEDKDFVVQGQGLAIQGQGLSSRTTTLH